jgi:HSP90 family molecular chaperone
MKPDTYTLQLDLKVLDHLGINLYSNAAAVLSEAVANAYDADSESVNLQIDNDKIVIEDDGIGMNLNQVNERFL